MEGSDEPLPDDLNAALDDLLDEATVGYWPGVEELCAQQPRWATRLRKEARAREQQKAGLRGTQPTPPRKDRDLDPDAIPTHIGPYRIFERLGIGGMGEVFKGERLTPTRQFVAIKVIKEGMATKEVLARFKLEQRALASMNHRAVARVYEAGATEKGEPYFVMEYISGLPLTDYCDKHKLTLQERIAVFQQVCGGVQHAHQKGFVHRDLKPSNILLAREGDDIGGRGHGAADLRVRGRVAAFPARHAERSAREAGVARRQRAQGGGYAAELGAADRGAHAELPERALLERSAQGDRDGRWRGGERAVPRSDDRTARSRPGRAGADRDEPADEAVGVLRAGFGVGRGERSGVARGPAARDEG